MIKIVLPFLLIGKALKPLAKIKKQSWKAMGSAFKSIQGSIDPMKSFSKIMEVLSLIMLPLTFIVTLLAQVIAKKLMPHINTLIEGIDDLGISADSTAWYMAGAIDTVYILIPLIAQAVDDLNAWFLGWDERQSAFFTAWDEGLDDISGKIEEWIEYILSLVPDPPGGDDGDDTPWDFWEEVGGFPVLGGSTTSTTNNSAININLQGSIIDNRAKLIQDITEAVIIRIG